MILVCSLFNAQSLTAMEFLDSAKQIPNEYYYFADFLYQQYLMTYLPHKVYNKFLYILCDSMGIESTKHDKNPTSFFTVWWIMMQWWFVQNVPSKVGKKLNDAWYEFDELYAHQALD